MMIKSSTKIKKIELQTFRQKYCKKTKFSQEKCLDEIKGSLAVDLIEFVVHYNQAIHDREIELSNGYVIDIGRGLDYFIYPNDFDEYSSLTKKSKKFDIGKFDYNDFKCRETKINSRNANVALIENSRKMSLTNVKKFLH